MSLEFRTLQPEEFYRQHLRAGERPDGRSLQERRPVTISSGHITTADGSAVVRCGHTTIVAGVKAELAAPCPDQPGRGYLVPNFSFSCGGVAGPGVHVPQQVTQFLVTVLATSGCVAPEQLVAVAGTAGRVWVLYIDLVCVDQDGNLLDTALAAMVAALQSVTLPRATQDPDTGEVRVDTGDKRRLELRHRPAAATVAVFPNPEDAMSPHLVSDPTEEEEQLSGGRVTVVTVGEEVCHLLQPAGDTVPPSTLHQAVSLALQRKSVCDKIT